MECSICFENIEENDVFNTGVCLHIFHNRCMCLWYQNCPNRQLTCPSCRIVIPKRITSKLGKHRTFRSKLALLVYCYYFTYYLLFTDLEFLKIALVLILLLTSCTCMFYYIIKWSNEIDLLIN